MEHQEPGDSASAFSTLDDSLKELYAKIVKPNKLAATPNCKLDGILANNSGDYSVNENNGP